MSDNKKKDSYYIENIPDLIEDLKVAVQNNRDVIKQNVTTDLSEDKYINVLKARRMAAEDSIFFLKEIDRLQKELNPDTETERVKTDSKTEKEQKPEYKNPVKKHSRQN